MSQHPSFCLLLQEVPDVLPDDLHRRFLHHHYVVAVRHDQYVPGGVAIERSGLSDSQQLSQSDDAQPIW